MLRPAHEAWFEEPYQEWRAKAAVGYANDLAERLAIYLRLHKLLFQQLACRHLLTFALQVGGGGKGLRCMSHLVFQCAWPTAVVVASPLRRPSQ